MNVGSHWKHSVCGRDVTGSSDSLSEALNALSDPCNRHILFELYHRESAVPIDDLVRSIGVNKPRAGPSIAGTEAIEGGDTNRP